MKSVKPGRGPSMMSGVIGVFVALFGVVWTFSAAAMGGGFIALFGVFFILMAAAITVYNFRNAVGKNRYSSFDITEDGEEPDPLNERFRGSQEAASPAASKGKSRFCPYCGTAVTGEFRFCSQCGKELP